MHTGEPFEGQSVAVLGYGNAAFETANALAPYVNYVHVVPGRAPKNAGSQDDDLHQLGTSCILIAQRVPDEPIALSVPL